jgi:hypothetical protein
MFLRLDAIHLVIKHCQGVFHVVVKYGWDAIHVEEEFLDEISCATIIFNFQ